MKWLALRIGGQRWGVYLVSPKSKHLVYDDNDPCTGMCDYDSQRIYISSALDDSARSDVLLHELLHALMHVVGAQRIFDSSGSVEEKDEALVSALTPCLHRLLADLGFRFPRGTAA